MSIADAIYVIGAAIIILGSVGSVLNMRGKAREEEAAKKLKEELNLLNPTPTDEDLMRAARGL